jgi:integrase/recombinase XerD
MLDNILPAITRRRLLSGVAADHIDDFAAWLTSRGHNQRMIFRFLCSLARWTDWMRQNQRSTLDVEEGLLRCAAFVKVTRRKPYERTPSIETVRAATLYIRFLRELKILDPLPEATPQHPILSEFLGWMRTQRGLADSTIDVYRRVVEDFVAAHGSEPRFYNAETLRSFVLARGKRHGISCAKLGATATRAFARFLAATDKCPPGLEYAIPAWTFRRHLSLPKFLAANDVERVVRASAVSNDPLRNKAILLLLARLGLRAGDIVSLRLSHIDWEHGRVLLCGKGKRQEYLPLSQEVGNSLLRYLKRERPRTGVAEVFVRSLPPFRKLSYQAVGNVVRMAIQRAGVVSPNSGSHVLRHSAATNMLRQGMSLAGIGAVLRHRSLSTTTRYAKVDHALLSEIAQPWPEVILC